jgi:hypothetical protein
LEGNVRRASRMISPSVRLPSEKKVKNRDIAIKIFKSSPYPNRGVNYKVRPPTPLSVRGDWRRFRNCGWRDEDWKEEDVMRRTRKLTLFGLNSDHALVGKDLSRRRSPGGCIHGPIGRRRIWFNRILGAGRTEMSNTRFSLHFTSYNSVPRSINPFRSPPGEQYDLA